MHKCKNPKYCPICRQKIRQKAKKIFIDNPQIAITQDDIEKSLKVEWWVARNILYSLEKDGVIEKRYEYNKRMSTGSGVKPIYILNKKYRPIQVNSKAWTRIF